VVDLWTERTAALGAAPDVDYVLIFENRGPAVGATITHPHGQIYAFDHVP
jgi:UDPglucose--hexose-1-phosphate uridylyltransferase